MSTAAPLVGIVLIALFVAFVTWKWNQREAERDAEELAQQLLSSTRNERNKPHGR